MAVTKVTNMIVPTIFSPYSVEKTTELSELMQAGIIGRDSELDRLVTGGGASINVPFLKEITGDSKLLDEATPAVPINQTTGQDNAPVLNRFEAFGSSVLAKWASGTDPLAAVAEQVGGYWARAFQRILMKILLGLFDNTNGVLRTTHRLNIYSDVVVGSLTDANRLTASTFADGTQLLGDASTKLQVVAMHSEVETSLRKRELVQDFQPSGLTSRLSFFNNRRVLVDDACPKVAGTNTPHYMTYILGTESFAHGLDTSDPEDMTETDRLALAHESLLVTRRRFALHPRGVRWIGTPASASGPSDAELVVGTNWSKVYLDKNIRIVAVRHNI